MGIPAWIVCLLIHYLVMASGLPLLVFSVMLRQGRSSLALVPVLLFNVLVVVLSLPTVARRQRVHGIVVKDDVGSVALRSFGACRRLLLDHGQPFPAVITLAAWGLNEVDASVVHAVVRLVGGARATGDPSRGRLAVAVGVGYAAAVRAGGISRLDEDGSLLGDDGAADVSGLCLDAHWTCFALCEGGTAVVAFGLGLAVGELVPDGLALFENVLVLELELLKSENFIGIGVLRCRGWGRIA